MKKVTLFLGMMMWLGSLFGCDATKEFCSLCDVQCTPGSIVGCENYPPVKLSYSAPVKRRETYPQQLCIKTVASNGAHLDITFIYKNSIRPHWFTTNIQEGVFSTSLCPFEPTVSKEHKAPDSATLQECHDAKAREMGCTFSAFDCGTSTCCSLEQNHTIMRACGGLPQANAQTDMPALMLSAFNMNAKNDVALIDIVRVTCFAPQKYKKTIVRQGAPLHTYIPSATKLFSFPDPRSCSR